MSNPQPDISIIIPTHNRASLLAKTLQYYNNQSHPLSGFEIIVIDDGSTDNTKDIVEQMRHKAKYQLSYFRQKKSGPAAARNKGILCAKAEVIFFTGDDIFPEKDLIRNHLKTHQEFPDAAVLGLVEWSQESEISDFMRSLAPDGLQFRYGTITDPKNSGFRHFYTSNISLAKFWLKNNFFDQDFPFGAMEDAELGYRLEKQGLKIIYNNKAVGYHYHPTDLIAFRNRMRLTGISSAIMLQKHPELKSILLPVPIRLAGIIAWGLKRLSFTQKINKRFYWRSQLIANYIEGILKGLSR